MGIWERLGRVIKSYLNDDYDENHDGPGERPRNHREAERNIHDSDYDAAYEELNDFLSGKDRTKEQKGGEKEAGEQVRQVPRELWGDFAELGLNPDAKAGECKEAYKKLLKIHHPDRHAGNADAVKKATEKTARINAAYDRLDKWFRNMV